MDQGKKFKRKKHFYKGRSKGKRTSASDFRGLMNGIQGFLAYTSGYEKRAVSELLTLLNKYADDLSEGTSSKTTSEQDATDISLDFEKELASLKDPKNMNFRSIPTGCRGIIFIQSCNKSIDPNDLAERTFQAILKEGKQVVRYCVNLLPICLVCSAYPDTIQKQCLKLFDPIFHTEGQPAVTFNIRCKVINNTSLKKDRLISMLLSAVTMEDKFPHKLDVVSPDYTIVMEVLKTRCCIGIIEHFEKHAQYNFSALLKSQDKAKE